MLVYWQVGYGVEYLVCFGSGWCVDGVIGVVFEFVYVVCVVVEGEVGGLVVGGLVGEGVFWGVGQVV